MKYKDLKMVWVIFFVKRKVEDTRKKRSGSQDAKFCLFVGLSLVTLIGCGIMQIVQQEETETKSRLNYSPFLISRICYFLKHIIAGGVDTK